MPYIPKEHEKYDLLPYCGKHGGEVFEYPYLLNKLNTYLKADDHLDPYGYNSYEDYDCEIDRVASLFSDQPEILELFRKYKEAIHELNCKEQWSVLRYIGPSDDSVFGLTHGRCYYWPSRYANPVYSGVIDDEEYTAYFHPTDKEFWEILEDPTGMAYNTMYGNSQHKFTKATHDHIMKQLKNAVIEE